MQKAYIARVIRLEAQALRKALFTKGEIQISNLFMFRLNLN